MVDTTAATAVPTTAAVEGITAGDFVPEVSWLDMRPEPIIPSNTNFLKYKRKPANHGRSIHVTLPKAETPIFRRRHPGLAGIALGAAVAMNPILGSAQGVLERAEGMLDQLKADIKGELQDLREEVAYLLGMESWIYGYPLVLMDVTRQVLTAAPAPNSEGTAAPINQLAKMPHYVSPYFKMWCGSASTPSGQRVGWTLARNRLSFRCPIPGTAIM